MKHCPENGSDKKRGIRLDCIKIKNLEIFAKHGVMPEENALGQKFVISIELECDVRKAGQTDDLNYSVNYAEVAAFVTKKATRLRKALCQDGDEMNTHFYQGKDFSLGQVIDLAETLPFLAERRVMFFKDTGLFKSGGEKLAEYLAQEILLQYDAVRAVTLEVKKPWAPVHLPLETVSVTVKRQWHVAYLSIGSNMGDKKAHLDMAVKSLNKDPWTRVKKVSSYIVTEPVGGVEQDDFLNGAVMLETLRTPEELLEHITDKTKILVLPYPNNPTGGTAGADREDRAGAEKRADRSLGTENRGSGHYIVRSGDHTDEGSDDPACGDGKPDVCA